MVETSVTGCGLETFKKQREMLKNLVSILNQNVEQGREVVWGRETREYGWGYIILERNKGNFLKKLFGKREELAVFEPVKRPEIPGEDDSPAIVDVRVYSPKVFETVNRIVSDYANMPENNVREVKIQKMY